MSGGGGGGGGGVVSDDVPVQCDKVRFEAQLSSPQPTVVGLLKPNEVLDIAVVSMKGQIVVQVLRGQAVVGGLAGPDATRLRNCIERGFTYQATVRSINGGQVRVFVELRG